MSIGEFSALADAGGMPATARIFGTTSVKFVNYL
jgi:hypothetical protein